jgi:hypothetical protein
MAPMLSIFQSYSPACSSKRPNAREENNAIAVKQKDIKVRPMTEKSSSQVMLFSISFIAEVNELYTEKKSYFSSRSCIWITRYFSKTGKYHECPSKHDKNLLKR